MADLPLKYTAIFKEAIKMKTSEKVLGYSYARPPDDAAPFMLEWNKDRFYDVSQGKTPVP